MALIHFTFSGFETEASDDGVAASNEDVLVGYNHGFNRLFWSDESLGDFISFEINDAHHLVPGGSEHHLKCRVNPDNWDWVSKLENCLASTILGVPLADSAVIGSREYVIAVLSAYYAVDFISVANHREQ